jgi:hypothetical protein
MHGAFVGARLLGPALGALVAMLAACSSHTSTRLADSDAGPTDAEPIDTGPMDTGPTDAGSGRLYGTIPFGIDWTALPPASPYHLNNPAHMADDANMVALLMDWFPIPWAESAAGTTPPASWTARMDEVSALVAKLGLPVYLALTPIGGNRDQLKEQAADNASGSVQFGQRCEDIATRADYQSVVVPGYQGFVEAMIQRFHPRYLAISVEINTYSQNCPAAWPDVKTLLNQTYDGVKQAHPDLTVLNYIQAEAAWQAGKGQPCFGFTHSCLLQDFATYSDLKTDLFGLSAYPTASYIDNGQMLPTDYLSVFATLQSKPLAICESGYDAADLSGIVNGRCFDGLPSTPADQQHWIRRMLGDADALGMPFAVNWTDQNLAPLADLSPCTCPDTSQFCTFLGSIGGGAAGIRFFGVQGLRDSDGTPHPALADWQAAVARAK